MSIFRRPDYTSEVTQFIDGLKAKKPTLEAEQRAGRALLWDKQLDRNAEQGFQDGRLDQQAYVYLTGQHPQGQ
jgi:hypothetical protein